jgi:uncharacterized protein
MDEIESVPIERRALDFAAFEVRHSGSPDTSFTVRGYPAVYGQPSLDLGGFREVVDPRAFDEFLATDPDVPFLWEHDGRLVGARTSNGTLELRSDNIGLAMEARVGPYSWAKDLRTAMERRDITQGSFGFLVAEEGGDEWEILEDNTVLRTVRKVSFLGDVTVTGQGAYPQTSMTAAVRSLRNAVAEGRLPERAGAVLVAPDEGEPASLEQGATSGTVNEETARARDELRHLIAVERDRISELRKRAEGL